MKLALLFSLLVCLSACGIKGKPLPPLPEEPLVSTEEKVTTSQPTEVKPLKVVPAQKKSK